MAAVACVMLSTVPARSHDLQSSGHDVHRLLVDEGHATLATGVCEHTTVSKSPPAVVLVGGTEATRTGTYTSREIVADFPFNEVVPSFNVGTPAGTGFVVWLRFRSTGDGRWTREYYAGTFGDATAPAGPHVKDADGELKIDCFRSTRLFDRAQYRLRFHSTHEGVSPRLVRFALCHSNTTGDEALWKRHVSQPRQKGCHGQARPAPAGRAPPCRTSNDQQQPRMASRPLATPRGRIEVPFRSQKGEARSIASRICSPTSLAMVLAYRGVDVPTARVAELVYDREHDIYGNWVRAVHTAYNLGVPGVVRRFHDLDEAAAEIARDQPLIISIQAAPGDLPDAPYHQTEGHLLVLVGLDKNGNPLVNDPAAATADKGRTTYPRDALAKAWLGHGGVAYVLEPGRR